MTVQRAAETPDPSLQPRQPVDLERLGALLRVRLAQDVVGARLVLTHARGPES